MTEALSLQALSNVRSQLANAFAHGGAASQPNRLELCACGGINATSEAHASPLLARGALLPLRPLNP